jgi:hypothetical protein
MPAHAEVTMSYATRAEIPRGVSRSKNAVTAVEELHEAVYDPSAALTFFFCTPEMDPAKLEHALQQRFHGTNLIGCTSAGEITPLGYLEGSITGASLPAGDFQVATTLIDDVASFQVGDAPGICAHLLAQLGKERGEISPRDTFGFLLIDGLSLREERVVSALYNALGDIPIFGGSAGDGLNFRRTRVYYEGAFRDHAAVFALVHTRHPFAVFKTQHFVNTDKRMVVTGADVTRRLVTEINGEVAAVEYARLVGVPVEALGPEIFATNPIVVRIGDADYVRALQNVHPNGSLSLFCAIDEGLVLTLARCGDMVENLERLFAGLQRDLGELQLVIGCDCILRNLELSRTGIKERVSNLLADHQVIGFSTYGEQYNAMHVNQTFTGVAIGTRSRDDA